MAITWQKMVPEIDVSDFAVSLDFYTRILGFKVLFARRDPEFAYLELEELQFMLSEYRDSGWVVAPLEKPYGRGMNLQMELTDIGPVYQRLLDNDAALFQDMKDTWRETGDVLSGQREFLVQDPDGYLLRFCQLLEDRPIEP